MVAAIILLDWSIAARASLGVSLDPAGSCIYLLFLNFVLPLLQHVATDWLVCSLLAPETEARLAVTLHSNVFSSLVLAGKLAVFARTPFRIG